MVKRVFLVLSLIIAASISALAQAAHPAEGTYSVAATGAEIGTVNFTLKLMRKGDVWSGEIVESPIPMTVKTVTVAADNKVTILASTGDAEVTIAGMLEGPMLGGDWTAGQAKGTWTATRKEAVAAGAAAPATPTTPAAGGAAAGALEGTYDAEVTAEGQGSLPFVLIIKKAGDKLVTEVPMAGDLNILAIEVTGTDVTLTASFQGNPFPLKGTTDGSKMGGKWEAGGFSGTWSAKKKVN